MPRRTRKPKRRPRQVTGGHLLELRCGKNFFGAGFGDDEEWRRSAWSDNRETVMARHREKHGPHTRAWGWWKYDAPEPRWRLTGTSEPVPSNWRERFRYGLPQDADPDKYETEMAYLKRLNLLTEAQASAANAADVLRRAINRASRA